MTTIIRRLRRAQSLAAPTAMLAVVLLAVCADPEALVVTDPESGPQVRFLDDKALPDWNGREVMADEGDGEFTCDDIWDCWNKCPEPIHDGGTTVCSCTRTGGSGPWTCDVTYYPPGGGLGEDGGDGCGGSDYGEEGPVDDTLRYGSGCPSPPVTVECDYKYRGETVTCRANTIWDDTEEISYRWWSDVVPVGQGPEGTGPDHGSWSGTATSDIQVKVSVWANGTAAKTDETTVSVRPRPIGLRGWEFRRMTHPAPTYSVAPDQKAQAWGGYEPRIKDSGALRPGSGPWAGQYYVHRPFQLQGHMHLHPDFDTTGEPHPLAYKTCSGVPSSANVLTVNTVCGLWSNLKEDWEASVAEHEQKHEDGANKCLTSGLAARDVLARLEEIAGTQSDVFLAMEEEYNDFIAEGSPFMLAMETTTSTPTSPVIWEHRDKGAWTKQALRPFRHNGTDGC